MKTKEFMEGLVQNTGCDNKDVQKEGIDKVTFEENCDGISMNKDNSEPAQIESIGVNDGSVADVKPKAEMKKKNFTKDLTPAENELIIASNYHYNKIS